MKTLIIIPALNEEKNIITVINQIKAYDSSLHILVVDDGSSDNTSQHALEAGAKVVRLPFNLGIGSAVQTGYQYAWDHEYDIAVQVDGDGQHDIRWLSALIEPVINNQADLVIGSRFLPPHLGYRSSWARRIGIIFFARLISFLIGQNITDPTSGFRACNQVLIQHFAIDYPCDFPEPESIVQAANCLTRVIEVPVQMHQRLSGHSSIRYIRTLYYMIKVTFAILLRKIKKKKAYRRCV